MNDIKNLLYLDGDLRKVVQKNWFDMMCNIKCIWLYWNPFSEEPNVFGDIF